MRKTTVLMAATVLSLLLAWPAGAASVDHKRPTVGFTTSDGAVLAPAPIENGVTAVQGWAKDGRSGIRKVVVTYCPGSKGSDGSWTCSNTAGVGEFGTTRATLDCNDTRRSCTWTAGLPLEPGSYLIFAKATDRAGNHRSAGPIQVFVA